MSKSRNGISDATGVVELALFAGLAYLGFAIFSSISQKCTQLGANGWSDCLQKYFGFTSPALNNLTAPSSSAAPSMASSIADLLTQRPTIDLSNIPASVFQSGSTSTRPSGTLVVVDATGKPQTYGADGIIPGTSVSVNDLRAQGISDDQIGQMIVNSQTNPGVGGGAGGSW